MSNAISLVILIATSALLVWSGIRTGRISNVLLRWSGVSLAGLLATAVSLLSVLAVVGVFRLHSRSAPVPDLKIASTPTQIQRGQVWKPAEFIATMRTGTDPSGHQLSKQMPWGPIGKLDDEELTALYEYLTHLQGSPSAARN